MVKKTAQVRIQKLRQEIYRHRYLYHVLDKQEISDAALDSLKNELTKLEEQYPDLITPDSPTQRVGGQPLPKFVKVEHQVFMPSLIDAFIDSDMEAWLERIRKLLPSSEKMDFFAEIKMDGLAVSLIYKNGLMQRGATRGDGKVGEDVTQNLKTIESIPLKLHLEKVDQSIGKKVQGLVEVRGEVILPKKSFDKLNKEQEKKGESSFANPRNAAAGSIRQLDSKIPASRNLDFLAYDLITDLGQKTHQQSHQLLKQLGFKIGQYDKFCKDLKEVTQFHKYILKIREKLPYWTDGIVVNVNNISTYKKLGIVGKAPRAVIAYKYPAEQATSVVSAIQVQVGRTGALTPVAHLKPVLVAGSTVSRATLHNEDEIERLDVRIGDTVIIQKAGDIIPDIVKVLPKMRTGKESKWQMPKKCPFCNSAVVRRQGEAAHYCTNKNCFAVAKENLYHFVSKAAFDINHLGPKIIDQLLGNDLIKDAADIFTLTKGDLEPLERFAEKSAANIMESIEAAREISLDRFIYALGIRHVGQETAIDLANNFGSIGKIKATSQQQLEKVPDIGGVVAQSIFRYFQAKKNWNLVNRLLQNGVRIKNVNKNQKSTLSGQTFVLTGALHAMTRDEAKEKVRSLGGDISSSVSDHTDFVVGGEDPGSKYGKAQKLGVKILSEEQFLKMVK
ncbi:MAG: NAD-dependent DNA ligase LigA [Patescibacteria group bacterium]